jgi:hypothetical protein
MGRLHTDGYDDTQTSSPGLLPSTLSVAIMTVALRKKIIGIGYPKFAVAEFKALQKAYDIHHFVPTDRSQVKAEIQRLVKEHGPFDAGYVVSSAEGQISRD